MRHFFSKRNQGFTLIEFMLAVGVGVGITAAVWAAYLPRQRSHETSRARDAIFEIIAQSNKAYAAQAGFFTLNDGGTQVPIEFNEYVNAIRSTPTILVADSEGGFTHLWGGDWELSADSSTCATDCAYDLITQRLTDVPPWACVQLVNTSSQYVYDTHVNGDLVALLPAPTETAPGRNETNAAQVVDLCSENENELVFRDLKEINFTHFRQLPMTSTLLPGEAAALNPQYARVLAAMADREAAQNAL